MRKSMRKMPLVLLGFLPAGVAAQTVTQWDGVYTDAQAERGSGQYAQHCAVCHGPALEGNGEAPPLTGEFIPDWAGTTLADVYDKVSVTMPLNAPRTLRPEIAADILAFILKLNGFPAGAKDLKAGSEALKTINFTSKPGPGIPAK